MNPRKVTAGFAIAYVAYLGHAELTIDQIRQWRSRGYVKRAGTDAHGYALYDLPSIVRHCLQRGYLTCD